MSVQLYNPFENLFLDDKTCFLTGDELSSPEDNITVFPEWILDRFDYRERSFQMIDSVNSFLYKDLKLPCSERIKKEFDKLDLEVMAAFDLGYHGVKNLDSQRLFLWISRIVYGTLFNELKLEKAMKQKVDKEFKLSASLQERFSYFHLMLQSLIAPMAFEEPKPWSIAVVKVKYSEEIFNYRDDAVNLIFSLGIKGFGIVACLQDNAIVMAKQQEVLDKIGDTELHPVQFEELCARVLYTNYLLQDRPKYALSSTDDGFLIKYQAPDSADNLPKFATWSNEMFGQVLEDYWTPWGLKKENITVFPNPPVSFLEAPHSLDFVNPEGIKLPY
ncbi:MAG TPA: hypothetical protein VLZ11_08770 [Flavobacterium sp.]|nr:hypothetical protein [Flavobacterium sp.]